MARNEKRHIAKVFQLFILYNEQWCNKLSIGYSLQVDSEWYTIDETFSSGVTSARAVAWPLSNRDMSLKLLWILLGFVIKLDGFSRNCSQIAEGQLRNNYALKVDYATSLFRNTLSRFVFFSIRWIYRVFWLLNTTLLSFHVRYRFFPLKLKRPNFYSLSLLQFSYIHNYCFFARNYFQCGLKIFHNCVEPLC